MKKYLTVGTDFISSVLFNNISDNNELCKGCPKGGLLFSEFNEHMPILNEWIWYLTSHMNLFFYKNFNREEVFSLPCSIVELKENSKIYNLKNKLDLDYLLDKYSNDNGWFSYLLLSKDFDGLNIDLSSLEKDGVSKKHMTILENFHFDSLLLFNPQCILSYQTAKLELEPFDYEFGFSEEDINFSMLIDEKKRTVGNYNLEYEEILNGIVENIKKNMRNYHLMNESEQRRLLDNILYAILEKYSVVLKEIIDGSKDLKDNNYSVESLSKEIIKRLLEKKDI